jgi:hypothetical protein
MHKLNLTGSITTIVGVAGYSADSLTRRAPLMGLGHLFCRSKSCVPHHPAKMNV